MNSFEQKLFNHLLDRGLISEDKARHIKESLIDVEGSLELELAILKISSEEILAAKGRIGDLPAFQLQDPRKISEELLREIPEDAARQYKIVPLSKEGKKLRVGIVNPHDYKAREAVRFIALGGDVILELYVITEGDFKKIMGRYTSSRDQIAEALTELEKELEEPREPAAAGAPEIIKEAPITKVVAVILKHAVEGGASDIHIEKGDRRTNVRFRVHGKLYTSLLLPKRIHAAVISRIKILSNLRLDESRIPQDGRFSATIGKHGIDFRVSTFPTRFGEKVALRVLDPSRAIGDFSELGLVGSNLRKVEEAINKLYGMILISGPTGSGKSTTLYAALRSLDTTSFNVVSLEDPVEYHIEGVNQSQIRPEIGYTFSSGLRHVLRQDPDIMMVGEIRDTETARLATHASLTGHLVFSTIHTKNAVGVVPRLIDMEVEQFIVPSSISLMIAQRLVRRLCPNCRVPFVPPRKIADIIKKEMSLVPPDELRILNISARGGSVLGGNNKHELRQSTGCEKCGNRGALGRTGLFEVLVMTKELASIIYEEPNEVRIRQEAERQGMLTMRQDGIIKALQGIISIEEALRVSEN